MVKKMEQAMHSSPRTMTIERTLGDIYPSPSQTISPSDGIQKLESNLKDTIKRWMESLGKQGQTVELWKLEGQGKTFLRIITDAPNASHSTPLILSSLAAGCLQQASSSRSLGSFGINISGIF